MRSRFRDSNTQITLALLDGMPGDPGSCCFGDFLAANSTGTKQPVEEIGLRLLFQRSFFRWRSSVLKLKPRLWQNSLRRIPLFTNSVTNC